MRRPEHLLKIGIIGTIVAAICCFTPVLVLLLSAIGFAAIIPALDFILLPLLGLFLALTCYAVIRKRKPS